MARILVLVENLSVPFDRRVWQESRALVDAGHEVHVVCPRGDTRDTESYVELEGVHIHRYTLRAATGQVWSYGVEYGIALFHSLRLALRLGLRRRFDVVHACNPPDLFFLVALVLKVLHGTRFVFDHHDLQPELVASRFGDRPMLRAVTRVLEWLTFRTADMVISTNDSYRAVAIERGGKPPEQVHVVRSAPDLDRFVPVEPEPSLRRGKQHLICYLGVMGPQDGVDLAVRAVASLRDELGRHDVHAAFVGFGDALDDCVALAHQLGLDDDVEFTGRLVGEDLRRYLSTADVCVAPDPLNPLNDVSTMNKIVEYMAMGRPVVAFDLREARVSAGEAALYARPNDVGEFARLVAELLDDPARREEMGRIARRRVESSLSWDTSRRNLLAAYDQLLASG